jgi:hypothetical protein
MTSNDLVTQFHAYNTEASQEVEISVQVQWIFNSKSCGGECLVRSPQLGCLFLVVFIVLVVDNNMLISPFIISQYECNKSGTIKGTDIVL